MKQIAWLALVTLISTPLHSGCDQSEIILTPEKASQARLLQQLKQRQTDNPEKYDQLTIELNNEVLIAVHGDSKQVENIATLASYLDQPASYYLEISNSKNARYSTNSRDQSMQVLLNPGRKVSLGERAWQSSPWRYYQGIESHKIIELELSADLQLNINIRNSKNNHASFLSGQYQLQEGEWIKLMGSGKVTSNRITTTQNRKQLWLRLHLVEIDADNQNQ
ncbi:MAG: hypothetical protein JKY50_12080 [Oleispira sp.]|nr:hypothetical protein [Oleispira sp.]